MTDVTAVSEGVGVADLSAFVATPFGSQCIRVGLATLASAVAALTICAVLPKTAVSSAPASVRAMASLRGGSQPVAQPTIAGFDVAQAWRDERALLYAAASPELRSVRTDAWAPAGGLAIMMASRFPSSGNALTTADAATVPMPPTPVARLGDAKRPLVARKTPATPATQLASLPPQAPEPGYFDFFRRLFANPDDAAHALLAANPKTAIYDIEKRVVYLPDGEKLEAHSGYGQWMDNPDSVRRKNLGVTPPNLYAVSFREKLFHGVRALRMTPVGSGNMYGRDGILAHSYMLGEDGQSNGCVSVRDYDRFLKAYESGEFNQIIVMRSVDERAPAQVASMQPGSS